MPTSFEDSPPRWFVPLIATVLVLVTACPMDEPPTDGETDTGPETTGPPPPPPDVVNDGEGRGLLLQPDPGFRGVLIGAPDEIVEGEPEAGKVFVLENRSPDGLVPAVGTPSVLFEDGNSPSCPNDHQFAWGMGANRALGSHLTFYSLATGGDPNAYITVTVASGVGSGVVNGRVLQYFECLSCAMFPRSFGSINLLGDEVNTNYGASVAVGFFDEASHTAGDPWSATAREYMAIGAPFFNGNGGVHIFARNTYRERLISNVLTSLMGDQQCDYTNVENLGWRLRTLTGGFASEEFGRSMVAADFNCDGYDDLAVGAPMADVPGEMGIIEDAGAVTVFYGGALGVGNEGSLTITQGGFGVGGEPEPSDQFGSVLAAGNFNGNRTNDDNAWSCFDLAVGTPNEDSNAGEVQIFEGNPSGLLFDGITIRLGEAGFPGQRDAGDRFGQALTAAVFDSGEPDSLFHDIAIGAPGDQEGGSALVVFGSPSGLDAEFSTIVSQADPALGMSNEAGDEFGFALTRASQATGGGGMTESCGSEISPRA